MCVCQTQGRHGSHHAAKCCKESSSHVLCVSVTQPQGPTEVIGQRVRTYRQQRGWSARELADRCREIGLSRWNREIVTNLEIGRRSYVSIDELFALAVVFGVPPMVLCVPLEAAEYAVTPTITAHPWRAAQWFSGHGPSPLGIEHPTPDQLRGWRVAAHPAHVYQRLDKALAELEQAKRYADTSSVALAQVESEVPPHFLELDHEKPVPDSKIGDDWKAWVQLNRCREDAATARALYEGARAQAEKALKELLDNELPPPSDLAKFADQLRGGDRLSRALRDQKEGGDGGNEGADPQG